MGSFLVWLVPAAVTGVACWLGWRARAAGAGWWNRTLGFLVAAMTLVVIVAALNLREPDVSLEQFLFGIAVGVLGLTLVPIIVFHTLGYYVRGPRLAAALWFLGTFALGPYAFGVGIVFLFGVACEPGCLS